MGILIYPERARRSPCECYVIGEDPNRPEDRLCFVRGIIGTLSDEQEREFCQRPVVITPSPRMRERLRRFRYLGKILEQCLPTEQADFRACLTQAIQRTPER